MTQEEFATTYFGCGMQAIYLGSVYAIVTINVQEKLFGLYDGLNANDCEDQDVIWVRCESVELVK